MRKSELISEIKKKQSYLCVGLDTDLQKIPKHLRKLDDPVFEFNKAIIDHTKEYCVAYKLNLAFYESLGIQGWNSLMKTVAYIPENMFKIADAKRGDIGNTAEMYARAFFETMNFDAVTLSPYMGKDSITPFLQYEGKWAIILGLTSNPGSADFQMKSITETKRKLELFEYVIETCATWGSPENTMFVIGATRTDQISRIRKIIPDHFMLVPGVGAQGGSLIEVSRIGLNRECGLLINSSRGIIYNSPDEDFAAKAGISSSLLQNEMKDLLISEDIF